MGYILKNWHKEKLTWKSVHFDDWTKCFLPWQSYIFLVETKKDDTEKREWKTETCKIDGVFEINCAKLRISTQREREWGKHWMCTDSFEHLKCCLLFPNFCSILYKRKRKKIFIHIHQKKLLYVSTLKYFANSYIN